MDNKLVFSKISEVMEAVGAVEKKGKNAQQGYSFRGIDDMYNALNEHLAKAKIFFASEVLGQKREERQTKAGGNLIYTVLNIKWTVYAEDGSFITTETIGEAMDSGDKSANKAMSAAYKYALMQIFCIPTKEEKDTEHQTHEVKPAEKPTPVPTDENCTDCIDGFYEIRETAKGKLLVCSNYQKKGPDGQPVCKSMKKPA